VPGDQTDVRMYLELGAKRVFACTYDWPGWCRSGKTEEQATANLLDYLPRYAPVAREAGIGFPSPERLSLQLVRRLPGTATTDFGAPDSIPPEDRAQLEQAEAGRIAALVQACWVFLDRVVATAPASLRKGPRGGGRDRDKVVEHVLSAEASYARKLGVRQRQPAFDDRAAISELRAAIRQALMSEPVEITGAKSWPIRYVARRMAWHVLDHAWEIQDKSV
jgi:hypothetical protein